MLRIVSPKKATLQDPYEDNLDDNPLDPDEDCDNVIVELSNGIIIKKRTVPRVIRFRHYSKKADSENYYRERLMLYLPWRNEDTDLYGGFDTYESHYREVELDILDTMLKYERNNDILETAIQEAMLEQEDISNNDTDTNECLTGEYAFFDPERPIQQQNYDIGYDMGQDVPYQTEVDCSGTKISEHEYMKLMQSLNLKQNELCTHVLQAIDTQDDPIHIFIEGGAGVGKTQVARAIYQSIEQFYSKQPGENPDDSHVAILAPTGMAAYHINGNTIHSGLHININKKELAPLNDSQLNMLRSKYHKTIAVMYEEVSMVGRDLFKKSEKRLQQIMGTTKPFGGLHVIAIGDFFQMAPVRDSYIFKDDPSRYGPLAVNLWKDYFHIYSLLEIMRQCGQKQFCQILNRLRVGELTNNDQQILDKCKVDKHDVQYVSTARHFFPLCETCRKHNEQLYESASSHKLLIHCVNNVISSVSEEGKKKVC